MNKIEQLIIVAFAQRLAKVVSGLFGDAKLREMIGTSSTGSLFFKVYKQGFFGKKIVPNVFPEDFESKLYTKIVDNLTGLLIKAFGVDFTERKLDAVYVELERLFKADLVRKVILPFISDRFLEKRRMESLSKEELGTEVVEKTKELQELNDVLEDKVRARTEELRKLLEEQHKSARLLIRRDLELTNANEKLRELDDRKSEFLSIAAHQLRTPLSGIKWTLSMIVRGELGPLSDDQKVFLTKSYDSNERMISLVEDMLHADRIDSGKYHLNIVSTQILDTVDSVLYEILPSTRQKNVTIQFDHGKEEIPRVNVDQEKIRAVFQNLLENAVKYSKVGGTVGVTVKHDPGVLTFSIKDDGIGIPLDQQENLFSRFFRARNALKIETDGTGLGLFIVKGIIEKHGGRIWYESKENEGSAFYFTIKI